MLEESRNFEILEGSSVLEILSGKAQVDPDFSETEQLRVNYDHMVHYLGQLVVQRDFDDRSGELDMHLAPIDLFRPYESTIDDGIFEILARRETNIRNLAEIATQGYLMAENIGLVPDTEKIYSAIPKLDHNSDPQIRVDIPPLGMRENQEYKLSKARLAQLGLKINQHSPTYQL